MFKSAYIGKRDDIVSLIPKESRRILDVGCSVGTLGLQIKQSISYEVEVVGIEIDNDMGKKARSALDNVLIGDVEKIDLKRYFVPKYFDCIILADILEHLKDPWNVLKSLRIFLHDHGVIIASLPNVRHYSTIFSLVFRGYWPYRDRGIHDKSHLRFFTLKNIKELFKEANLEIISIFRNYRIIESPHKCNHYSKFFAVPILKDFITFQYLVVARKKEMLS